MDIKVISPDDMPAIKEAMALVRDVFWDFEAADYSDEGILEFEAYIDPVPIRQAMDENRLLVWGAYVRGEVIGVIAVRPPCHISLFFVRRRYHRKGVGKALFGVMRDYFKRMGVTGEMTVHSSPFAVEVYKHLGFAPTSAEKCEHGIRFVPMCLNMERT